LSECKKEGKVIFIKVATEVNLADFMTKPLGAQRFNELKENLVHPIGGFSNSK
jgi:hypothetical protein